MDRVKELIVVVILITAAVAFPTRLWWDLKHPEKWNGDAQSDPRIYGWVWAAAGTFVLGVAWYIVVMERKDRKRARLAVLLNQAEELVRQHRREEAAAVLKECEDLFAQVKSTWWSVRFFSRRNS